MLIFIFRLVPLFFLLTACSGPLTRSADSGNTPEVNFPRVTPVPQPKPSVVTTPLETELEPVPKKALESLASQEPMAPTSVVDGDRPVDAAASPYPGTGELPPAPGALPAIEPVIEPALPVIDNLTPPDQNPPRTLSPRIGEKLFAQSAPPAVVALEGDIETQFKSRNYGDAAAQIDRALRIQPKNPELWHVLAEIRLRQNQPALAEDLAKKSNSLAKTNADLVKSNWRIIADARRQRGDGMGAQEALEKAW